MKLFKNTLLITALFITGSACARATKGTTTATTKKTVETKPAVETPKAGPALPSRSFQSLLMEVRTMPSAQVINEDGVFTDKFSNLVKAANLNPELTRALLEAGRNLHLRLSGDDEQDKELILYAGERIDGFIADLGMLVPYQPEPLTPSTGAIVPYQPAKTLMANFYDPSTKLIKPDYLEERARELLQTKTADQTIAILSPELTTGLGAQWRISKIKVTPALLNQAHQQIKDTVTRLEKVQKEQGQMVPYQPAGAIVPYEPVKPLQPQATSEYVDKAGQEFVTMLVDMKKDTLKRAISTPTSQNKNYSKAMITDVLNQLYKKYPTVTQEQAIRMLTVAIDLPIPTALPVILDIVRNYKKPKPTAAQLKATPLAIEYGPAPINANILIQELNPAQDPMFNKIIQDILEKEKAKGLQVAPYKPAGAIIDFPSKNLSPEEYANALVSKNIEQIKSDLFKKDFTGSLTFNTANNSVILAIAKKIKKDFPNETKTDISNNINIAIKENQSFPDGTIFSGLLAFISDTVDKGL